MPGKNEFRQAAFQRRKALDADLRADWSRQIMDRLLSSIDLPPPGSVIAGYVPVNNEVDVVPLMTELVERGYRCAVPYNTDRMETLDFLEWTPQSVLHLGLYNIPQPDPKKAEALLPDFLVVPMLAFDASCNRMGYGSGYFDRTFMHLQKFHAFRAVGVAFEAQKYDAVPVDGYDYTLDAVVSETDVYTKTVTGQKL